MSLAAVSLAEAVQTSIRALTPAGMAAFLAYCAIAQ